MEKVKNPGPVPSRQHPEQSSGRPRPTQGDIFFPPRSFHLPTRHSTHRYSNLTSHQKHPLLPDILSIASVQDHSNFMLVKMSSNTPQKLLHGHGWTAPEFLDAVFKNPESVDAFSSMLTQEDHESIFAAIAAREEELKESIPELRKEASSTEGSESMGTCGNPKTSDRGRTL